jgi:hypothetical protein
MLLEFLFWVVACSLGFSFSVHGGLLFLHGGSGEGRHDLRGTVGAGAAGHPQSALTRITVPEGGTNIAAYGAHEAHTAFLPWIHRFPSIHLFMVLSASAA